MVEAALKQTKGQSGWALVGVFTLTIFLSATLLFSVQPLFAKLVLPLLGGSSGVWNTAMVFFQGTLLCGYIYAHLISKYLPFRAQIAVHILIMAIGLLFLPLSIAAGWTPPESGAQSLWLIALFSVSIGVPFFAISANAPLLQRWLSRTDHKDAEDPYFLYAASNAGSLISLCAYPLLIEPFMRLQEQTHIWSVGYMALIMGLLMTGILALRNLKGKPDTPTASAASVKPAQVTSWRQRLMWIVLAFIPSSLMLGVTAYMTTNIASAPFLWIMPLALYLLTFIFVFAKKPILTPARLRRVYIPAILIAFVSISVLKHWMLVSIFLCLLSYFVVALVCHGRLADTRPDTDKLTEFYIWMSLGGVLGGIFNALIAPQIFTNVYEYIAVLVFAILAAPTKEPVALGDEQIIRFGPFVLAATVVYSVLVLLGAPFMVQALLAGGIMFLGLMKVRKDKAKSVVDGIFLFILVALVPQFYDEPVLSDRSFFGVIRVKLMDGDNGPVHQFVHGDIIHNYQFQDKDKRRIPLAYYAKGSTFEQALTAVRDRNQELSVAIIGLGAGAMSCYEKAGDDWTYFEIDPAVVKMALNPDYFSYIDECSIDKDIRIGDARLTIAQLPEASQDIIMVDAFSSDAIPTHLVTREALALYQSRLKPDGVVFFHTSNRLLDVASVVVRLADDVNLASRHIFFTDSSEGPYSDYIGPSEGVLVGRSADVSELLDGKTDWQPYKPSPYVKTWSDDYSSIIGPMRAKLSQGQRKIVQ